MVVPAHLHVVVSGHSETTDLKLIAIYAAEIQN